MDSVVHFEMPAEDKGRVAKFYTDAFGWDMQQMGKDMNDYLMAVTAPVDPVTKRNATPGTINGGFFDKQDKDGYREPHLVINVENLDESIKKVTAAGGELFGEPMDIPGTGRYVSFRDTEGNLVGMLQPKGM